MPVFRLVLILERLDDPSWEALVQRNLLGSARDEDARRQLESVSLKMARNPDKKIAYSSGVTPGSLIVSKMSRP